MMKSPQSFHDIINQPGNRLAQIGVKLKKLQQLNQLFQHIIKNELNSTLNSGGHLANNCHIANFERNRITIAVANSSIATQLRYRSPIILQRLRHNKNWAMVRKIDIIVSQHDNSRAENHNQYPKRRLSANNANKIRQIARQIKNHQLKKVLEQLARRADSPMGQNY